MILNLLKNATPHKGVTFFLSVLIFANCGIMKGMGKGTSTMQRYLRDSTPNQRKAALIAALMIVAILLASIALFFAVEMDLLRPTPTTAAESQYLRSRDAEQDAIAAARVAGAEIDSFPEVVTARLGIASAQLDMGQVSAATQTIDLVLNNNPQNIRGLILQGNIYEVSSNYNEALKAYQSALDYVRDGDTEAVREALRGRGQSLRALGEYDQSLDALTRAALILPESITLHLAAGDLALDLERWQTAATHFYSVLRFEPSNEHALERLRVLERDHSAATRAALEDLTSGTAFTEQRSP